MKSSIKKSILTGLCVCAMSLVSTNGKAQTVYGTNLFFVSDVTTCDGDPNGNAAAVKQLTDNSNLEVLMTEGNNCTNIANPYSYFNAIWGNELNRIHAVPGNHDYMTGINYFDAQYNYGRYGVVETTPNANWAIIRLDTNHHHSSYGGMEREEWYGQMDWLAATLDDLDSNGVDCVITYGHAARYTSGLHQNDDYLERYMGQIWDILLDHDVELYLSGHDHHYERMYPMGANDELDWYNGTIQLIAGTGGASLRSPDSAQIHENSAVIVNDYGVLELQLFDNYWVAAFVDINGATRDFTINGCH